MFRAKAHRQVVCSKESEKTATINPEMHAETKRPKQKYQPKRLKQENDVSRAVARALIGGGGGAYSYIQVLPD